MSSAKYLTGLKPPVHSSSAAVVLAPPETPRIQLPTLIGEVTLKTRNMFRKRSGRPRSEISSAGLTTSPRRADVQGAPGQRLVARELGDEAQHGGAAREPAGE